jgi:hypothetical protein
MYLKSWITSHARVRIKWLRRMNQTELTVGVLCPKSALQWTHSSPEKLAGMIEVHVLTSYGHPEAPGAKRGRDYALAEEILPKPCSLA